MTEESKVIHKFKGYTGRKLSEEWKRKISEAKKGKKGHKHSDETKRKIGEAHKGSKNSNWLGNNISYRGMHRRIRKVFPKTDLCMICLKVSPTQLACITGNWKDENLKNWAWFCQSCHMRFDNVTRKGWIKRRKKTNP